MAPTSTETAAWPRLPDDAAELFEDARAMHAAALARLDANDIRDAAEKAWCATRRASDALIAARTGIVPAKSPVTTRELSRLASNDPDIDRLTDRYHFVRDVLHGDCFYSGLCEPLDRTRQRIRETADYIDEAERLAAS